MASAPYLLSSSQVQDLIKNKKDVSVLDATWFMPNSPRNSREEFVSKHLPNAQFLDLDEVASPHELGLKHMLPSEQDFASACEKFNIRPTSHVVLYDSHGVFSSPRALYMFRTFGHSESSIINGGLPQWEVDGLPTENGPAKPTEKAEYPKPQLDYKSVRNYEQIAENATRSVTSPDAEIVVDARPRGRFLGVDPEPRPGLSSGHIPNSFSLPFSVFLNSNQGPNGSTYTTVKSPADIRKALDEAVGTENAEAIIKGQKSIVASCGSGMTAGVLWLGLKLLGVERPGLYDESWTGYAARPSSKIEKSS